VGVTGKGTERGGLVAVWKRPEGLTWRGGPEYSGGWVLLVAGRKKREFRKRRWSKKKLRKKKKMLCWKGKKEENCQSDLAPTTNPAFIQCQEEEQEAGKKTTPREKEVKKGNKRKNTKAEGKSGRVNSPFKEGQ